VAGLAAMARGQGEPGTSAAECRVVTPGFMADLHGVRDIQGRCCAASPILERQVLA